MAPISEYVENTLGFLFSSIKGHDAKLLSRTSTAFVGVKPTVNITSSDLGASSPGQFTAGKHDLLGGNLFPELNWTVASEEAERIRSWLLVVEDADAPLPSPIVHGIYHDLAPQTRSLASADFKEDPAKPEGLSGHFKYGANRRGTIWTGPRPVLGHGNHRYFFQLIGLNVDSLSSTNGARVTKDFLLDRDHGLQGKVICWGEYVANFERKL